MRRRVGIGVVLALAARWGPPSRKARCADGQPAGRLRRQLRPPLAAARARRAGIAVAGRISTDRRQPPPAAALAAKSKSTATAASRPSGCRAAGHRPAIDHEPSRPGPLPAGAGRARELSAELGGGGPGSQPPAGSSSSTRPRPASPPCCSTSTGPPRSGLLGPAAADPPPGQGGIRDRARYPAAKARQRGRLDHPDRARDRARILLPGRAAGLSQRQLRSAGRFHTAIFTFARGTFRFAGGTDLDTA